MLNLAEKDIATPKTFERSILTDPQVYHWFLFLMNRKNIKERLAPSSSVRQEYKKVSLILAAESIICATILGLLTYALSTKIFTSLWMGLFAIPLLISLHYPKKKAVAKIGMHLLSLDFSDDELRRLTLFQIGEFYSKEYAIVPLVDYIVILDRISQTTVIAAIIFIYLLRPATLNFYKPLIAIAAILIIANALSKIFVPYLFKK